MPARWLELSVQAQGPVQETISSFLVENGSTGVVCGERSLRAFFPEAVDDAALRPVVRHYLRGLRDIFDDGSVGRTRWRVIAEKNWHDGWRDHFKPQRIGRRFLVAPPWNRPAENRRYVIVIEPAMAFGTGTHETTRSCLEFIDEFCTESVPAKALDVGTGSGILAMGMARLGVGEVLALDNDPVALEAVRANLRLNGLEGAVTLSDTGLGRVRRRFPLVVANIILETLVELAGPLNRCVAAGGSLILSGLLHDHVPMIMGCFRSFRIERRKDRKEWSTLMLRKEP